MSEREARHRRGHPGWILLLLAAVFFVPIIAAVVLYHHPGWRPSGHTNHGRLIEPPQPLPQVPLARADGAHLVATRLTGKWSLIYIGDARCDAACRQALYVMQQNFLGLGDDMPRVQRLFLATAHCCDGTSGVAAYPGMLTLDASTPAAQRLLREFPARARASTIFVVDPLGNLMMRFDASTNSSDLITDLRMLLSLSNIG